MKKIGETLWDLLYVPAMLVWTAVLLAGALSLLLLVVWVLAQALGGGDPTPGVGPEDYAPGYGPHGP